MELIISGVSSGYSATQKKAEDIQMSVRDNPLRETSSIQDRIRSANMDRLWADARMWDDRTHGEAYRAIRSMVLNKGE